MRSGERLLHEWVDGHKLTRDRYQWIVRHHSRCKNARRGVHLDSKAFAQFTYLTSYEGIVKELKDCRLDVPKGVLFKA